jgi:regulator of protease activity HflC (stomatin/prohibitin superfamily)
MSVLAPQRPGNKVIHAEGEAQAAEKLSEAANIISVYPAAIHLQFLQTLTKVAAEKNSTTILPFPIDILAAFLQKKEKE